MKISRLKIKEVLEIRPDPILDSRGSFSETFRKDILESFVGQNINFCQENESTSVSNVFRGLHYQLFPFAQSKLISVVEGKILDFIVDIRKGSSTFGKNIQIELSDKNKKQVFIPRGFAHGFHILSKEATIVYKVDNYYSKIHDRVININDTKLNLNIDLKTIILSDKDFNAPNLADADLFNINDDLYE